ncbi:unnamed protein product, partial [Ilex paraguariensis]
KKVWHTVLESFQGIALMSRLFDITPLSGISSPGSLLHRGGSIPPCPVSSREIILLAKVQQSQRCHQQTRYVVMERCSTETNNKEDKR